MKKVNLYTDGACSGNPGPGGYGCILVYNGVEKEFSGGEDYTTNNRMEIMAVIEGFEQLSEPCDVTVTSDSEYVCNTFNKGWIKSWVKRGWKKSDGKPVINQDLWERLLKAIEPHKVTFVHILGHNGHYYNERCDKIAVWERDKHSQKL